VTKTESSWSQVPRPRPRPRLEGSKTKTKTKTLRFQDQDRDRDSRVPRPRPKPRLWGSKTKTETETKTCKNGSRDVSRRRLKSRELQVWITQCYLPPGRGDFPSFTPAEAGTRFSDPGGMQGWAGSWSHWLEVSKQNKLPHIKLTFLCKIYLQ